MDVTGSDGMHVGTVDSTDPVQGIKLTKNDPSSGGVHHWLPMDLVGHVGEKVVLLCPAEEAKQSMAMAESTSSSAKLI